MFGTANKVQQAMATDWVRMGERCEFRRGTLGAWKRNTRRRIALIRRAAIRDGRTYADANAQDWLMFTRDRAYS